ncbi:MAG TPA: bacillithiol biosynthesis deacetylase BshB2 [Bacillota bacterium]
MERERPLLVALAHPDDEVFACAGVIALRRQKQVPVTYLCATLGQMGRRMGRPAFATRESLPALRERELREAVGILGLDDLRLLRFWDKTLEFLEPERLIEPIRTALAEVEPATVITFHPRFGGHPDHNAIGYATVRAVAELEPGRRPTIWFPALATEDDDPRPDLPLVTVDITAVSSLKQAAFRAHRSQTEGWEDQLERNDRWRRRFAKLMVEERFWVCTDPEAELRP